MPYKSKAQQRYMHAAAARGEIPKKVVEEWDRETERAGGFKKLPDRKRKKKHTKAKRKKTHKGKRKGKRR